jgi:hypothetical protein
MSLEQQIATLVGRTANLLDEVAAKMAHIDQRVTQKRDELEAWRGSHLDEHAAMAINFNARMTAHGGSGPNTLPLAMGVNAGGDFWSKFDAELIPVRSGTDPLTRPPVVRELLQYMGCDREHFSGWFDILKLTIKSIGSGFGPYVFHIPYQHVKVGTFNSVVMYHKIIGGADWSWMNNGVKGQWHQVTHHANSNDAGGYNHVDIGIGGLAGVGDTLYLALPQIIPGKWNPARRCPQLYNVYDIVLDVVASGAPPAGMLGGSFAGISNLNR